MSIVTVMPSGKTIEVAEGTSLLAAILGAEMGIPTMRGTGQMRRLPHLRAGRTKGPVENRPRRKREARYHRRRRLQVAPRLPGKGAGHREHQDRIVGFWLGHLRFAESEHGIAERPYSRAFRAERRRHGNRRAAGGPQSPGLVQPPERQGRQRLSAACRRQGRVSADAGPGRWLEGRKCPEARRVRGTKDTTCGRVRLSEDRIRRLRGRKHRAGRCQGVQPVAHHRGRRKPTVSDRHRPDRCERLFRLCQYLSAPGNLAQYRDWRILQPGPGVSQMRPARRDLRNRYGLCIDGPCRGKSLKPIALAVIDGEVCTCGVALVEDDGCPNPFRRGRRHHGNHDSPRLMQDHPCRPPIFYGRNTKPIRSR